MLCADNTKRGKPAGNAGKRRVAILQRRLVRVSAAPTLALCAGLWIAMWPGAANATVNYN